MSGSNFRRAEERLKQRGLDPAEVLSRALALGFKPCLLSLESSWYFAHEGCFPGIFCPNHPLFRNAFIPLGFHTCFR